MSVTFPSLEFFSNLQAALAADPARTGHISPSDAYCGLEIGDRLFVIEFDGRTCSSVTQGGNPLDLDFVVSGTDEVWHQAIGAITRDRGGPSHSVPALVARGVLEIQSEAEDGGLSAAAAMGLLQAFLDGARDLDVEYA